MVSAAAGYCGWRIARALFPYDPPGAAGLHALVLCIAGVLACCVALGTVGRLLPGWWLCVVLLAALAGLSWFKRRERAGEDRRGRGAAPGSLRSPTGGHAGLSWGLIWGVLFALLVGHIVMDGLFRFPTDYDCLMYHQPLMVQWLHAGSLYAPQCGWWWSPGNSELIGLWMAAPFSGDFLVPLNNLPVVGLWALAMLETQRQLGVAPAWRNLGGLAAVLVHTTLHETDDASNDLAVAAFFFAGIAYGLRFSRSGRRADLVLCGLSLGLLAGVKYFAAGYAVLAGAVVLLLAWRRWGTKRALSAAAVLCVAAIPCGAYWYVRNWIVGGSPIFPMGLSSATPALGYPADVASTSFLGNDDPARFGLALEALWRTTGPCHMIAVAILPALAVWLIARSAIRGRQSRPIPDAPSQRAVLPLWPLALLIAGSGLIFAATPFAVEDQPGTLNHLRWAYTPARYALCFLSMSVLGLVAALDRGTCGAGWRTQRAVLSMFCAGVIVQAALRVYWAARRIEPDIRYGYELLDSGLLGLNLALTAAIGWMVWRLLNRPRWLPPAAALIAAVGFAAGVSSLSRHWHENYAAHFSQHFQTRMFHELQKGAPAVDCVAVLDSLAYPFFGPRRERRVFRPRYVQSPETLVAYLRRHRLRYVVATQMTGQPFNIYGRVPGWIDERPQSFTLLAGGARQNLYRFNSVPAGAAEQAPAVAAGLRLDISDSFVPGETIPTTAEEGRR